MKGNYKPEESKACSCIRGAGLLGQWGGHRRPLAFPRVTRVLGFVLLPCKALLFLAKVLLSGFCCSPGSARPCKPTHGPVLRLARFACTHKDTRAIRYLQARVFPGGFLLPCWPATALSQGFVLLAAVARGYAVGLSRLDPKKQASTSLGAGEGELCFNAPGTQRRSQELHFTANFHSGTLTSDPCFPLCTLRI